MKKGAVVLTVIGAAVGTAAACFTGTVAACCVAAYVTIENAKAKRAGMPRITIRRKRTKKETPVTQLEKMCYYLEKSSVYHTNKDCRHIANRENVLSSTVDEAVAAGKERKCALCGE